MKIKHPLYFVLIILSVLLTFAQSLHAQTCRNDITPTTPTQDFTLHNNGTVTHHKTGLMWMRCTLGQNWNGTTCITSIWDVRWADAFQAADSTDFAGYNDWRLPNIKELASIIEEACFNPAINATVFPATITHSPYWSSSPYVEGGFFHARVVGFSHGSVSIYERTYGNYVRLVRGGQ